MTLSGARKGICRAKSARRARRDGTRPCNDIDYHSPAPPHLDTPSIVMHNIYLVVLAQ